MFGFDLEGSLQKDFRANVTLANIKKDQSWALGVKYRGET